MTIRKKDIEKIAHLARINISQEESQKLENKLVGIMSLIDKMQTVDTANIEPMSHALDISQPLRKDEVTESDLRKNILPLAPETEEYLFIVPQVIE
ncbi:MAG: Asp-tRNA(Asn)/Glu-tRNA(Gln) amidotransferase subunit GatC [Methylophilaceae bacterium]|jgi:aspartyl-tRNA(Asn)/glutamyl-tRNA(Gln) amidotransferase subunit C|nr:Asp-tRNA(Asn)/Glu-tRNA(Gln) amidotransferase subunit GatC [Methylophilaceae bacterium]